MNGFAAPLGRADHRPRRANSRKRLDHRFRCGEKHCVETGTDRSRAMNDNAPWHAHIYYEETERRAAESLRAAFADMMVEDVVPILFIGRMTEGPVGPHPIAQFEIHFSAAGGAVVARAIEETGLRALIHPLTDDDLADHTTLAHWIGEPLELDVSVLDPPGHNQGVARFGISDF